jgi:hypothetical protein
MAVALFMESDMHFNAILLKLHLYFCYTGKTNNSLSLSSVHSKGIPEQVTNTADEVKYYAGRELYIFILSLNEIHKTERTQWR